jgi:cell division cycle 2-like protein
MPETARHGRWQVPMSNPVVTLFYRAPELLMGARWYTETVDMWSVGYVTLLTYGYSIA